MNIGNYDFVEFSKFDLLEYERSIVILCKKSARVPFVKNKNTGFLHKRFSAANITCQLNSLSIGEHFILAYPRGLKAKEIIFFVIGEKLNKNLQRSLGSKLSELILLIFVLCGCDQCYQQYLLVQRTVRVSLVLHHLIIEIVLD